RCDAEVARLRDLEPAAERVAVNRGDERLGGVLDALELCVRAGRTRHRVLGRPQQLEGLDVGAGDEGGAGADQHDGFGGRVGDAALHRLVDLPPDRGRQRIHRRVVDRDDGDAVFQLVADKIRHEDSLLYSPYVVSGLSRTVAWSA